MKYNGRQKDSQILKDSTVMNNVQSQYLEVTARL